MTYPTVPAVPAAEVSVTGATFGVINPATEDALAITTDGNAPVVLIDSAGVNVAGVDSSHNVLVKVNAALPAGANVIGHTSIGGASTTAITAGTTGNTVIKASAGRLHGVLVTTAGSNATMIYDNATTNSGTIIGALAANAAIGFYTFNTPAANGITVDGDTNNGALTVSWS